jgi:predicted TIM-barrel fold metal-dependent hydrolase
MIIDGHSHVTLPVEEHIRKMNEAGVDKTVLFTTTFHPETAKNTEEVKTAMHYLNDLVAGKKGSMEETRRKAILELTQALSWYPDRFIGFGSVPAGLDYKATLQFIDENIRKNRLSGMGEFTVGSGQTHLLQNVFQASREFENLPVWIHAFFPLNFSDIKEISKYAKEYPEVPVILGHLGGVNWLETMELVGEIPNLYLDTSAFYSTFVLGTVINALPEKCIFGVDLPFGDIPLSIEAVRKTAKTKSVADAVLGENILKLLRL